MLAAATWSIVTPAAATIFPYNYVGTYEIRDGGITYTELGSLDEIPACATEWAQQELPTEVTVDPVHIEKIKMSSSLGKWVSQIQKDLVISTIEATCLTTVTTQSTSSGCDDYVLGWGPESVVTDPLSLPVGWSILPNSTVAGPSLGPDNTSSWADYTSLNLDLRYNDLQPKYTFGPIPFTGRMMFRDPSTNQPVGEQEFSRDFVAGRCFPDGAAGTCGLECKYLPADHRVESGARRTMGLGPLPVAVGPLGDWTQWLDVCNTQCL